MYQNFSYKDTLVIQCQISVYKKIKEGCYFETILKTPVKKIF